MLKYRFRDPIHGFIEVSRLELKIIDSAPFQRLRNIKQLSTTYLVYPGAEHSRFGHSLGVLHLVTRAFESALENYRMDNGGQALFGDVQKEWYRQILRLIALTHDLGHAPFSHGSEELFEENLTHEDYTKKIICETEIACYIREIGEEFRQKYSVGEEYDITPELLWLIYGEKNPEFDPRYRMPDFKFLKSFMDSELDCDKMDYLLRDSYYCGVNYGKYDLNRLLSSLSVYYRPEENIMQLAIKSGGVRAFEEFVIARYFMFIQVYFHKTRRYLDRLLVDNLAAILPGSKFPDQVDEYLKWDDLTVMNRINKVRKDSPIAEKFLNREVMTCVFETPLHSNRQIDLTTYFAIRNTLNRELQNGIVEDTAEKLPHKIPTIETFDSSSGKGIPILVNYYDKPLSIADESILLVSLTQPINIRRIYVDKIHAEAARTIVSELINERTGD